MLEETPQPSLSLICDSPLQSSVVPQHHSAILLQVSFLLFFIPALASLTHHGFPQDLQFCPISQQIPCLLLHKESEASRHECQLPSFNPHNYNIEHCVWVDTRMYISRCVARCTGVCVSMCVCVYVLTALINTIFKAPTMCHPLCHAFCDVFSHLILSPCFFC